VKLKWFASVACLVSALCQKITLVEYIFIPRHIWYVLVVQLRRWRWVIMSGKKKVLGKPKQYSIVKSFDMYACKIQKWKFGLVLTSAYRADLRKAYCKLCNNTIIDWFLAFNCCKKDQNNTENLSERTSFGVKTLRRQRSMIPSKMCHVLLSRAPASETYFTFFLVKCAMQNYFHNVQVPCYCCVTRYETRTTFFAPLLSLEVKLLWCNAFARGRGLGR